MLAFLAFPAWSSGDSEAAQPVRGKMSFLFADGPPMKDYLEALVKDFTTENPGVDIEVIWTPWGQFEPKIIAMHTGGVAPDLHQIDDDTIPFFASKGLISPMDDFLEREGIKKRDYSDIIWELTEFQGKSHAITLALKPRATIYNKKMFADAGLSAPTKWSDAWTADEFLTAAQKLVQKSGNTITRYAWTWDYWCWDWIPYSNGGRFFSKDMTEYMFDDPESTEGLQFVADMAYKHDLAIPFATAREVGGNGLFTSEKIAMYQTGIWSVNTLRTEPDLDWDVMPHFKLFKKAGTECSLFTFAIPAASKNKDITYRFAKYLLDHKAQTEIAGSGRFMPTKKTAYEDPSFLQPDQKPAHSNIWVESLDHQGRWPFNVNGPQLRETIRPMVDVVWAGEATAAEALKKPEQEVESLLAELRAGQ
jgi:ABC-type glycerol-3-phosphate transport system substrate-binding protein